MLQQKKMQVKCKEEIINNIWNKNILTNRQLKDNREKVKWKK